MTLQQEGRSTANILQTSYAVFGKNLRRLVVIKVVVVVGQVNVIVECCFLLPISVRA